MALLTLVSLTISAQVSLHTPKMTLVLNAENGKAPQYVYFGSRLSNSDLNRLQFPTGGRMDAYPAYGMNCMAEAALALRQPSFTPLALTLRKMATLKPSLFI